MPQQALSGLDRLQVATDFHANIALGESLHQLRFVEHAIHEPLQQVAVMPARIGAFGLRAYTHHAFGAIEEFLSRESS